MDLTFIKTGGEFVSEFDATSDFNLHLEGVSLKDIRILQKTAGTKYSVIRDVPTSPIFANVFDYDFSALVYPKHIKVECNTEPSYAAVTFKE